MQPGAALITGGARRLGRAMALDLARLGWDVVVNYGSSRREAEDGVAEIRKLGRRAEAIRGDLLDHEETLALVPAAVKALGRPLTLLVNNASIFEYDTLETADARSWDRHVGSNL
ncbi:MAG: SDR family NAD(P)-dependent oxidoreductase, partial [Paracoccaceae bacterium]